MLDLDQAIRERHSTRLFLPQPVPRELLNEALALAQHAPSNSNIQPWHMVFAAGACRDRLVAALIDEAQRRPPNIPPLPASFQHFRSALALESTGRWESLARTRRAMQLQSCATGNFSARQ
jgi:nitroreductase